MTAYARAENGSDGYEATAEIRGYNSKNLDIALHIGRPYLPLEERIKAAVATHVHRGRVELRIDIKELEDDGQAFQIDWARAHAYCDAMKRLQDELNLAGSVSLDLPKKSGISIPYGRLLRYA